VEKGEADFGMLPVENSISGSIHKSFDLLLEHDLRIAGETLLEVRHCLLAPPGGTVSAIRSNPRALEACARFVDATGAAVEIAPSAAGAARDVAAAGDAAVGALAGRLCARRYGLEVVEADVDDESGDYTRFLVLAKGDGPGPTTRPKTSLAFAVIDRPGSLAAALGEFGRRNINIVKIASRPRRRQTGPGFYYVFFVGFEGTLDQDDCKAAVLSLLDHCAFVRNLGSYDAAPPLEPRLDGVAADPSLLQI